METSVSENARIVQEGGAIVAKIDYIALEKAGLAVHAVNHTMRGQIIRLLDENKRMAVMDIYVGLRMPQAVASHHLAILRNQNIVAAERQGREVFYSLNHARIMEIILFLNKFTRGLSKKG